MGVLWVLCFIWKDCILKSRTKAINTFCLKCFIFIVPLNSVFFIFPVTWELGGNTHTSLMPALQIKNSFPPPNANTWLALFPCWRCITYYFRFPAVAKTLMDQALQVLLCKFCCNTNYTLTAFLWDFSQLQSSTYNPVLQIKKQKVIEGDALCWFK